MRLSFCGNKLLCTGPTVEFPEEQTRGRQGLQLRADPGMKNYEMKVNFQEITRVQARESQDAEKSNRPRMFRFST